MRGVYNTFVCLFSFESAASFKDVVSNYVWLILKEAIFFRPQVKA